jgi:hypothetical protein
MVESKLMRMDSTFSKSTVTAKLHLSGLLEVSPYQLPST